MIPTARIGRKLEDYSPPFLYVRPSFNRLLAIYDCDDELDLIWQIAASVRLSPSQRKTSLSRTWSTRRAPHRVWSLTVKVDYRYVATTAIRSGLRIRLMLAGRCQEGRRELLPLWRANSIIFATLQRRRPIPTRLPPLHPMSLRDRGCGKRR